MGKILELLESKKAHKIIVTEITNLVISDKMFKELMDTFRSANDVDKGTLAEVMKFVSEKNPKLFLPYTGELINYIDYKAPKVRWGIPESIGHIAREYPEQTDKALPKLLINLNDKSTVVRWCAAFAITEIAKYNKKLQKELITKINGLIKKELNNGVKNVYIKALKVIENS